MKRLIQVFATTSALCLAMAAGAQQAPPPSKAEPAKPKAKKVWTNDDVTTLRTPVDDYEEAKRKQAEDEAAKASQKSAASQSPGDKQAAKPKDYLPKTLEEAQQRAEHKKNEIQYQYEAIDIVKKEAEQATNDAARAAFQKRIDTLTATLQESVAEMHAIDARLEELKANPPAPSQPAAPAEASSPEVAELQKQIAEKQGKIEHNTEYIQPLRDAIAKADSESVRGPLQTKLDGFLALIEKDNAELKTLEGRLQELKSKPPAPKPEAPKPETP